MTSRFDGRRSIPGDSSVANPEGDAPAVDPTSSVVDFPDLSDLDRGLYPADGAAVRSSRDRTSSNDRRHWESVERDHADTSERRIGGWAAVAVVVLGLVLGGSAAMAVFRDDVSHILSSWDAAPTSSHSLRLQ